MYKKNKPINMATGGLMNMPPFIKKDEVREFMHEALSRNVFSFGALYAAKQISKLDPRIYRFQDI